MSLFRRSEEAPRERTSEERRLAAAERAARRAREQGGPVADPTVAWEPEVRRAVAPDGVEAEPAAHDLPPGAVPAEAAGEAVAPGADDAGDTVPAAGLEAAPAPPAEPEPFDPVGDVQAEEELPAEELPPPPPEPAEPLAPTASHPGPPPDPASDVHPSAEDAPVEEPAAEWAEVTAGEGSPPEPSAEPEAMPEPEPMLPPEAEAEPPPGPETHEPAGGEGEHTREWRPDWAGADEPTGGGDPWASADPAGEVRAGRLGAGRWDVTEPEATRGPDELPESDPRAWESELELPVDDPRPGGRSSYLRPGEPGTADPGFPASADDPATGDEGFAHEPGDILDAPPGQTLNGHRHRREPSRRTLRRGSLEPATESEDMSRHEHDEHDGHDPDTDDEPVVGPVRRSAAGRGGFRPPPARSTGSRRGGAPAAARDGHGGAPPGGSRPRRGDPGDPGGRRPRSRLRVLLGALAALALVAVVAVALVANAIYQPLKGEPGDDAERVRVEIPRGATAGDIAEVLEERDVIDSARWFNLRARLAGERGELKSGTYTMPVGMTYEGAIDTLVAGPPPPRTVNITVAEGRARRDIAPLVENAGVRGDYLEASASSPELDPSAYGAPAGTDNLEGFLFPATYELPARPTAQRLVRDQVRAFKEAFGEIDLERARTANLSRYEVVIIASMIEREAQVGEERRSISAVIWNRLEQGIPLGIDATIRYAENNWDRPLRQSELERDTPYNTRINQGLPPTPIGNPGKASLEAAANPANEDYLYYVVKPGTCGEHSFSETDAEFQRDVQRYNRARERAGGESPTECP
jgi:UPF0755 protein